MPAKTLNAAVPTPPPKSPYISVLLLLIVILIFLGVMINRSMPTAATSSISQMIDVGLALVATVVCYMVGPTIGAFASPWGRTSGSAAVFMLVLALLYVFKIDRKNFEDEWKVSGEVTGLPDEKSAQVRLGECLPATIPPGSSRFQLNVSRTCAQESEDLVISVESYEDQREHVVSLRETVHVKWIPKWKLTRLEGHVYQKDGVTAASGVEISLDACPGALDRHIVSDFQGKFLLDSLPTTCRLSYKILCTYNGKKVCELTPEKPYGIKIITNLTLSSSPPSRYPKIPSAPPAIAMTAPHASNGEGSQIKNLIGLREHLSKSGTSLLAQLTVSGDAGENRQMMTEALARVGIGVLPSDKQDADLKVQWTVQIQSAGSDNGFVYVRWTMEVEIALPKHQGEIIVSFSRTGREGHSTLEEATAKAQREMSKELTPALKKEILGH